MVFFTLPLPSNTELKLFVRDPKGSLLVQKIIFWKKRKQKWQKLFGFELEKAEKGQFWAICFCLWFS